MGTIVPTTNHSTGRDDHPLAFEVTSAERSRLGRPSSFLNGKEREQAFTYSTLFAQLGGLGDAALPKLPTTKLHSDMRTLLHSKIWNHFASRVCAPTRVGA